ncbi:cell division protein FtsL [Mangrovitalea sediminis]|uniref:cell division protein FtsL n=1 Tax=Mangrovitalea sediminis TaxID=1982043 RepID=UPI000BE4DA80|nr:cell division protein FtsL [Mangrovitalea sediminis]
MGAVSVETGSRSLRWRDSLASAWRLSRLIFRGLWRRDLLITLVLVGLLITSAVGVIYAVHLNRQLFSSLNHLQVQRDAYQRTWSQLLLEESALSAHSRVEQHAVADLNMKVPGRDDITLVVKKP